MPAVLPGLAALFTLAVIADQLWGPREGDILHRFPDPPYPILVAGCVRYALLMAAYIGLGTHGRWLQYRLSTVLAVPLGLAAFFGATAAATGHAVSDTLMVAAWFLSVTALAMLARFCYSGFSYAGGLLCDIGMVVALWMPIEHKRAFGTPMWSLPSERLGSVPFVFLEALLLAVYLFTHVRALPQVGWNFSISAREAKLGVLAFLLFALPVGIPIAMSTDFALPQLPPSLVVTLPRLIGYPLGVFFYTAMVEEFFFRGVVQNMLMRMMTRQLMITAATDEPRGWPQDGRVWGAFALSCMIFAVAHYGISPDKTDIRYGLLALLASVAYGLPYLLTGKITPGAITRALVDVTWNVLFARQA